MPDDPLHRWEYRLLTLSVDESSSGLDDLNAAGRDGWEVVGTLSKGFDESVLVLKRELVVDPGPPKRVGFA
jgi:hypothetical protein